MTTKRTIVEMLNWVADNPESESEDLAFHDIAKWNTVQLAAHVASLNAKHHEIIHVDALSLEILWRRELGCTPDLTLAEFEKSRCKMFGYCDLDEDLDDAWKQLFQARGYVRALEH